MKYWSWVWWHSRMVLRIHLPGLPSTCGHIETRARWVPNSRLIESYPKNTSLKVLGVPRFAPGDFPEQALTAQDRPCPWSQAGRWRGKRMMGNSYVFYPRRHFLLWYSNSGMHFRIRTEVPGDIGLWSWVLYSFPDSRKVRWGRVGLKHSSQ